MHEEATEDAEHAQAIPMFSRSMFLLPLAPSFSAVRVL
jgi:hypothetical protein